MGLEGFRPFSLFLTVFLTLLTTLTLTTLTASAQLRGLGGFEVPKTRFTTQTALNFESVQPGQQVVMAVVVDIADGFHAQSATPSKPEFIAFTLAPQKHQNATHLQPLYLPGVDKTYAALGQLNVYSGKTIAYIPFTIAADAPVGPLTLRSQLTLQICDDQVCFAPESIELSLTTNVVPAGQTVSPANASLFANFDPTVWVTQPAVASASNSTSIFGITFRLDSWLTLVPLALVVGVLFNVVPCVLPVLPLKAIGFYETAQHNRAKCFALGGVFSLGIIATFAILGAMVFILQWVQWGEFFGNFYFALIISLILLVMALGMMGLFEFALPTSVYSLSPRHDTYTGNFLFGILTAVLSTPCTFGPFFAVITWAASKPGYVGLILLTLVGLGMALPYLFLSGFPELARKFPRTGPWSNVVKQMMGIVLIGVAIYFAQPLFPEAWRGPLVWWAIFVVVCAASAFLMVRTVQLAPRARPLITSAILSIAFVVPSFFVVKALTHQPYAWGKFSPDALATAQLTGKPVVVKFTAAWCANCHAVEALVYGDEQTIQQLNQKGVIPLKADLTSTDAVGWQTLKQLNNVGSIPFTAIYLPGQPQPVPLSGIYSSQQLLDTLK
jgi:thiol:disulfide interchange protein